MEHDMSENAGIRIKAVVLGFVTDLGCSLTVAFAYGLILGVSMALKGIPPEEIHTQLQGPVVLIPGLVFGFGFTILGGYVAGRIAKYAEILHGGIVGGIGIILGVFFYGSLPLWYSIVSFAGVIPAGMAGGCLARQTHQKTDNTPS
jgi:hypothetical protein